MVQYNVGRIGGFGWRGEDLEMIPVHERQGWLAQAMERHFRHTGTIMT
jgi:hypothetical protein